MESRANYVAVGAFVLLMTGVIIGVTLWLAQAQFQAQYVMFEVHVPGSVSGLDLGSPVRRNGIEIGRVAAIQQDPQDPALVNVMLRVRAPSRLRADSVASITTQGLTGSSFIEIIPGTAGSPSMDDRTTAPYPVIAFQASGIQEVLNKTPLVLSRLTTIEDQIQQILNEQNRAAITESLENIRDLTAALNRRAGTIDALIVDSGQTMHNLAGASTALTTLLAHANGTLAKADQLAASANTTFAQTGKLTVNLNSIVQSDRSGLHDLTTTVPAQLNELLASTTRLTQSLNRISTGLEQDPSRLLLGARDQGYRPQ
jgi:phospholipid/cholesterol/gamma-HCH transport system substrate-binding protein